jgi:opacity protein-like surface antigen
MTMKRIIVIAACALALSGAALAATRTYEPGTFDGVSVAAGISVDITLGATRSVVAETRSDDFDDLQVSVEGNVLKISRPARNWFSFGRRPSYQVHVVTPVLRSLSASSGADAKVKGSIEGDFSVESSSGSDVEVSQIRGGNVKAHSSSGSDLSLGGSCVSLEAEASSGSDLDADDLTCEKVDFHASSGSDISVTATKSVTGKASSGSDVKVAGAPPVVQVDKSSGADIDVRK